MFRSATLSSHTFEEYTDVQENPKEDFNLFGNDVVISGDGLQAACRSNNAVTLLNAATGQQIARLDATSNGFEFGFGEGMSMDFAGNIIAVDNEAYLSSIGQVKLFNPKTGALIDTILRPSSGVGRFGNFTSLSDDGTRIAIASTAYDGIGVCHIFSLPSKTLLTAINNPSGDPDSWGQAISLSGDGTILAVGAPWAIDYQRGRVNIYNVATGTLLQTLTGLEPYDNNQFGISVSLNYDGTLLAVGEKGSNAGSPSGIRNGKVYLFNASNGSLLRTYSSPVLDAYYFGQSVSLSSDGSTLIVGGRRTDAGNSGYMFFFTTNSSTVVKTLTLPGIPGNPNPNEGGFGESVGVSHDGTRIVTGAVGMGVNDFSSGDDYTGRFYIYNFAD